MIPESVELVVESEEEVEGVAVRGRREMRGRKKCSSEVEGALALCTGHFLTHSREAPHKTGFRPRENQLASLGARA